jgi:predicted  nucleic acid-binding Zn-ribbon protein
MNRKPDRIEFLILQLEAERTRLRAAVNAASVRMQDFDRMIAQSTRTIARTRELVEPAKVKFAVREESFRALPSSILVPSS